MKTKRLLAMLMALVMMLSLMPMSVLAAGEVLPDVAFYTQPEANANYMIQDSEAFTVTETNDTIYLVATNGYTFESIREELVPGGIRITMNADRTIAEIKLPHVPMQNFRMYLNCIMVGWNNGHWYPGVEIMLNSNFPGLYYRTPRWDANDNPYEDLSNPTETGFNSYPKKGTWAIPYFFDGTTEYRLADDQIYSDNEDVVILNLYNQFPIIEPVGFGTANICYQHTDGKVYSFPVNVEMFYADFYSTSTPSEESFLREFVVTNTDRTFYLAALDGFTISNVRPGSNWPDSDITVSPDGSYATITIKDGAEWNENRGSSELIFTLDGEDGIHWEQHFEYITLINGGDKMFFYNAYDDGFGNMVPDTDYRQTSIWSSPFGWNIFPMLQTDGKEVNIDPTKLVSSNPNVVTIIPDKEQGTAYLDFVGFGDAEITYTVGDNIYRISVTVGLPDVGFYSHPEAKEEYFIRDFTISDDNDTLYLVALDGCTFSNLMLYNIPDGTTHTVNTAGTVATITLPHKGFFGSFYAECEVIYDGYSYHTGYGIEVSSVYPTFGFYYANYENGTPHPSDYFSTSYWSIPTSEVIYPMMAINGKFIPVDPAKVSVKDTSVSKIAPSQDDPASALDISNLKPGQTELVYEHDGTAYSIPVIIELPEVGFYTAPKASAENFVHTFHYSKDNNTLYLINTSDQTMVVKGLDNAPDGSVIKPTNDPNVYEVILGHDESIIDGFFGLTAYVAMTNSEGFTMNTEANCALIIQNEDPCKDGHTIVDDAAVAPTCVDGGLTAGKHCSVCGEVTVAQKAIPATGHFFDKGTVIAAPTCTTDGKAVMKCTVCGYEMTARNLDELLVRQLTDTAYMVAGSPVYDYNAEYIVSRINPKFFRDWDYSIRLEIPADVYEAEVARYFKISAKMIQEIREYGDSQDPQYTYIKYNADSDSYTLRLTGGFGGWEDPRKYVGYVQNGNTYTAYYCYVNYVYLSEVLSNGMTEYEYAETLGNPDTIEYNGHIFTNSPDGYCYIESYENSGRAVAMERNGNVIRIVDVFDFTATQLPKQFNDVDGGKTGHTDNNGDVVCDICGANICANHVPTAIPAVDPTCTKEGLTEGTKCANCGLILEQQEVIAKLGHDFTEIMGRTPNCTDPGTHRHYNCSRCQKNFDYYDTSKELTEIYYGEPTGHHFVVVEGKDPTCTEAGNLPHRYCDNSYELNGETVECPERFITIDGVEENWRTYDSDKPMFERAQLPMLPHTLKLLPAVEATYTAAGNLEHYSCGACHSKFMDAAGEIPTTKGAVTIPQKVEVTAGKAEVKEEVIEEAISNSTETTVTLPLTETKEETTAAQLPVASLEKIAEANKELTVETNFASVTMDAAALQTIASAAGESAAVELKVEPMQTTQLNEKQQAAVAKKNVAAVISAEILCGDENIHDFEGGKVTVKVPFTMESGTSASDYVLIYVDDMGNMEIIDAVLEGGYLIAVLDHFSEYVVINTKVEPTPPAPIDNPFVDVAEENYFYDAVLWAVQKGITGGIDATHFAPNNPCTRGQVVTFLWRANGSPEPQSTQHPFTDISADKYYYKAVLWAVENGITAGLTATTFAPNNACTRGQIATFLWRANGSPEPQSSNNPFSDVNAGPFYKAILWAVEQGITTGYTDGTFRPGNVCTRGNIVTFLYRAEN